ncbi:MAG: Gfo/Idh/MocA family oxidoreductase [Planctomycetota bacterium]
MAQVRVGIVGAHFAAHLHANAYRRCPDAAVVAVASRDAERAARFARENAIPEVYGDYREMLAKGGVDLVSVCVPNHLHCEVVLACAAAHKAIVCEKPLATTSSDAKAMVKAAAEAGVSLMYAEDWVFAPALLRAREIIAEGALGDLLFLKAKETHSGTHSPYAQKLSTCGGGAMIHLGIHPLACVCHLKEPQKVVEVSAVCSGGGPRNLLHTDYEGEDWAVAVLTFEDGTRALVEGNYVTVGGLDDVVEIYGSLGVMKINLSQGSPISVYSQLGYRYAIEKADMTTGWTRPAVDEELSLGYPNEIAHFVDCVLRNRPCASGVRAEDGLRALLLCEAIYESARLGRAVRFEE